MPGNPGANLKSPSKGLFRFTGESVDSGLGPFDQVNSPLISIPPSGIQQITLDSSNESDAKLKIPEKGIFTYSTQAFIRDGHDVLLRIRTRAPPSFGVVP